MEIKRQIEMLKEIRQIEMLKKWACEKAKKDCYDCDYSIFDEWDCCPFSRVLEAAEDRAREVQKCHT